MDMNSSQQTSSEDNNISETNQSPKTNLLPTPSSVDNTFTVSSPETSRNINTVLTSDQTIRANRGATVISGAIVLTIDIEDYKELQSVKCVSTFLSPNIPISEVLQQIAKKGNVNLDLQKSDTFQLLYQIDKQQQQQQQQRPTLIDTTESGSGENVKQKYIVLDKNKTLSYYGIKNKERLLLRKLTMFNRDNTVLSLLRTTIDLSKRSAIAQGEHLIGVNLKTHEKEILYLEKELIQFSSSSEKVSKMLLNHNQLSSLPSHWIDTLTNLRKLNLSDNRFAEFPEEIFILGKLEVLHLEHNQLESISSRISILSNLQKFYLQENFLEELPEEICKLNNLKLLNLDDNNLKKLPSALANCSRNLKTISVSNNFKLISPPFFLCMKGASTIMKYLRTMQNLLLSGVENQQKFLFRYKISFSTGKYDILENDSCSYEDVCDENIANASGDSSASPWLEKGRITQGKSQHLSEFRLGRMDSIFVQTKHTVFFFLETGQCHCTDSNITPSAVSPLIIRPFQIPNIDNTGKIPSELSQKKEVPSIEDEPQMSLFCLFDGVNGNRAAEYCRNNLSVNFVNQQTSNQSNLHSTTITESDSTPLKNFQNYVYAILTNAFCRTDEEFLQIARLEQLNSGASCCCCLLIDNELLIAHTGNCKAILCRGTLPIRLNLDHDFSTHERERLLPSTSIQPPLSRGFGFLAYKEPDQIVLSKPEIHSQLLNPRDQFLIIATCGVWNEITEEKAIAIVMKSDTCDEAAQKLVETAVKKGAKTSCSAIVVRLCWHLTTMKESSASSAGRNSLPKINEKQVIRTSSEPPLTSSPRSSDLLEKTLSINQISIKDNTKQNKEDNISDKDPDGRDGNGVNIESETGKAEKASASWSPATYKNAQATPRFQMRVSTSRLNKENSTSTTDITTTTTTTNTTDDNNNNNNNNNNNSDTKIISAADDGEQCLSTTSTA